MSGIVSDNQGRSSGLVKSGVTTYDDDKLQSNIALLGFKFATQNSLAKYNLQDQIIDEYEDATGIDAGNSTNERLASGVYDGITTSTSTPTVTEDADDDGIDGDYTWYKWTDTAATGSYNNDTTQDHEWLIVAGGGSGGRGGPGGGGGAGGYRAGTTLSLTGGNEYTVTVGAGGAATSGSDGKGTNGSNSILSGTGITTITSTGGGAGGAGVGAQFGGYDGGSGGAPYYHGTCGTCSTGETVAITQYTAAGETRAIQGYNSSTSSVGGGGDAEYGAPGGGGAGQIGQDGTTSNGGDGGIGIQNDISGTNTWYAGGGGGGTDVTNDDGGNHGAGANGRTQGGGGTGNHSTTTNGSGTANTGGGGGAAKAADSGAGGSGIVILRRLTTAIHIASGGDLTLQSTANTASSAATKADLIILMENAEGTATINTDIKGYVTADGGSNWTEGTLVDEGSYDASKKILAFHDATVTSGTDIRYKITTHNQSLGSKETKIHATSIGWKA